MVVASWIAFITYAVVAVGLGWTASRRPASGADYWTAGRSLSGAAVGVSISAGFMSVSWSCVYAVQLFYWYGLGAVWLITLPWLAALAGIFLLADRYHSLSSFSQPEMVRERFGTTAQRLVAVALAFVFLVWGGAEIHIAAALLAPSMATSTTVMIFLITAVVAVYATVGGFRAVVDTDKLQFGLVTVYLLTMAWLALRGLGQAGSGNGASGAWETLWRLPLNGAKSEQPWTSVMSPGLVTIALTTIAYLPGWLFETDLWLRVQAARDNRAARRGIAIAAGNALLWVGALPLLIGVASLTLFPVRDGQFPAAVGAEGDAIFAALVTNFAPDWLALVVAIGLVAAAMSTIDTCTNVTALSVAYDLLGSQQRSPDRARRLARVVTLATVIVAGVFALYTESLWHVFYLSSGILTTAVAFPVFAVFVPWATRRAVTWSSGAGFASTLIAYPLETRGLLSAIEPSAVAASGLGFILWGVLGAVAGCVFGLLHPERPATA